MKFIKKFRFNSPVVLTFVFISFIAFVLNYITNGVSNRLLFSVYRSSLVDPLTYVRMLGHSMGHLDWSHFSGNIIFILLLGPLLEEKYGSRNISVVMIITALVTGIVNIIFFPAALLGASGIVFAFILLSSITCMKDGKIPVTFVIVAAVYIGGQVVDGVFVRDNISNLTHIIGGIIGAVFGYALNKNK